jgi:hypothetical protein
MGRQEGVMGDIYIFYFLLSIKDMKNPPKKQKKLMMNNIEELLIKEYYLKYLPNNSELFTPNTIYDREILNNYSKIVYSPNRGY